MTPKTQTALIGLITLLVLSNLAWEQVTGGVATHYLLHDGNLPGFSNWWGLLTYPVLGAFLIWRISGRVAADPGRRGSRIRQISLRFAAALLFGGALSLFFTLGFEQTPLFLMIGSILLSFIIPLNRSEFLLGFMLGMLHTFGGVLPVIIGAVLMLLFTIGDLIRRGLLLLWSKVSPGSAERSSIPR